MEVCLFVSNWLPLLDMFRNQRLELEINSEQLHALRMQLDISTNTATIFNSLEDSGRD